MQVFSVCDFLNSIVWMRYIECNTWISFFYLRLNLPTPIPMSRRKNVFHWQNVSIYIYFWMKINEIKNGMNFLKKKKTKLGLKFPFILLLQLLLLMFCFLLNYWTFERGKKRQQQQNAHRIVNRKMMIERIRSRNNDSKSQVFEHWQNAAVAILFYFYLYSELQ